MRRALTLIAAVALVIVLVIGLTQAHGGSSPAEAPHFDLPAAKRTLASAPPPLNGIYAQANELIGGGKSAFDKRLAELRGTPVVINKWASWCVPCQSEFPVFESVATKSGKQVAFLGVNGTDKDPAARKFLAKRPLPFPSYTDPKERIARSLEIPANYPMTVFLDRKGKTAYIHSGQYTNDAQLTADIRRYLG
jgi:cytochrome c biogenesis protein CcmG, thiol:disulfide interchange protein DsbE